MQENLGFWIFMGAVMLALILAGSRERIERQRTLQRMLERNEEIDEDLVNRLLRTQRFFEPETAYRRLRALGVFVMAGSIPVGVIAAMLVAAEHGPTTGVVTSGVAFFLMPLFVGLGLFLASRFFERPDQSDEKA